MQNRLASLDAYRGLVLALMMGEALRFCGVAAALETSAFWAFLCHHQSHVAWVGGSLHDRPLVPQPLPARAAVRLQPWRLPDAELHPHARHDGARPARGGRPEERPLAAGEAALAGDRGCLEPRRRLDARRARDLPRGEAHLDPGFRPLERRLLLPVHAFFYELVDVRRRRRWATAAWFIRSPSTRMSLLTCAASPSGRLFNGCSRNPRLIWPRSRSNSGAP